MPFRDLHTIKVIRQRGVMTIQLHRPEVRNAMNLVMVRELAHVFDEVSDDREVRVIVLRGSEGHFCAGGDIADMREMLGADEDPARAMNRSFGRMLQLANKAPQFVVSMLDGVVLGGGMGLACVSDVTICHRDAMFGMPETQLGLIPAQIAPFVVARIGLTEARRLALLGTRFNGKRALELGLVQYLCDDLDRMEGHLDAVVKQALSCSPEAIAQTKRLLLRVGKESLSIVLDEAADAFTKILNGPDGQEGTLAFREKRKPKWAEDPE